VPPSMARPPQAAKDRALNRLRTLLLLTGHRQWQIPAGARYAHG
jgi:hypothetical protein